MYIFFLHPNKMWKPIWSSQFYVHINDEKPIQQTKSTEDKTTIKYTPINSHVLKKEIQ